MKKEDRVLKNNRLSIFEDFVKIGTDTQENTFITGNGFLAINGEELTATSAATRGYGWALWRNRRSRQNKKTPKDLMDPKEFFKTLKSSFTKIVNDLDKQCRVTEILLKQAINNYQTAFAEKLEAEKERVSREKKLLMHGFVTYIKEEDVVNFYKKTEKGVKLDWIKNFVRLIPKSVKENLAMVQNFDVFDNYVIMHYDPDGEGSAETKEEEVERKKDPILFGVMECSNRLYYIDDWIDEYCDLTLSKLLTELDLDYDDRELNPTTIVNERNGAC